MASKLRAYAQLMRLPNVFTAMADPLAGVLVAAGIAAKELHPLELVALLGVSACLYSAGTVWNDYFDYAEDATDRPNRPLPSGRITLREAKWLAITLMAVGLLLAASLTVIPILKALQQFNGERGELIFQGLIARPTLGLALALSGLILAYNFTLKLFPVARELGMGCCRALNFLLGLTLGFHVAEPQLAMWAPAIVLLLYVAMLTAISRLEIRIPATRLAVKYLVLGIIALDAVFVWWFHGPMLPLWVLALLVPALVLGKFLDVA